MPFIADIRELAFEIADLLDARGDCHAEDKNSSCKARGRVPLCRVCCANKLEERIRLALAVEKLLNHPGA